MGGSDAKKVRSKGAVGKGTEGGEGAESPTGGWGDASAAGGKDLGEKGGGEAGKGGLSPSAPGRTEFAFQVGKAGIVFGA